MHISDGRGRATQPYAPLRLAKYLASPMAAGLVGSRRVRRHPHHRHRSAPRAASPAVPALSGPGPHLNRRNDSSITGRQQRQKRATYCIRRAHEPVTPDIATIKRRSTIHVGLYVRRVRFVVLAPDTRQHRRCQAEKPVIGPFVFSESTLLMPLAKMTCKI